MFAQIRAAEPLRKNFRCIFSRESRAERGWPKTPVTFKMPPFTLHPTCRLHHGAPHTRHFKQETAAAAAAAAPLAPCPGCAPIGQGHRRTSDETAATGAHEAAVRRLVVRWQQAYQLLVPLALSSHSYMVRVTLERRGSRSRSLLHQRNTPLPLSPPYCLLLMDHLGHNARCAPLQRRSLRRFRSWSSGSFHRVNSVTSCCFWCLLQRATAWLR